MSYETIRYDVEDELLILRLDRPSKMNAFTIQMCEELEHAYSRANRDDRVRAIVVTGIGKAFCAGLDLSVGGNVFGLNDSLHPTLNDLREHPDDPEIKSGVLDAGGRVTLAMLNCLKPIVGAVNGVAVGVGATMTLAMDFRLASEAARFGFIFGRIGITPEACSTWFLPRIVGLEQALEWIYRADIFDAQEALEKKLVRSLHAPDALLADACAFARSLVVGRSSVAIALARQMLYRNSALSSPVDAHNLESLAIFYASMADGKEGVAAFLQKRPPAFTSLTSQMPPFYPWTAEQVGGAV
jgi:enoyl-CoA hydratase/carnithine racemase